MTTIFRAALDTRHYSFEAFGASARDAEQTMKQTVIEHARAAGIDGIKMWRAYRDDVTITELELGAGYRDGQKIFPL